MAAPVNIFTDQTGEIALVEIPVGDDPVTVRVDGLANDDFLTVLRKSVVGHTQPAGHQYPDGWEPWKESLNGPVQFSAKINELVIAGKGNKALFGTVTGTISAEYQV